MSKSKFGNWVLSYGVDNLATALASVNPRIACTPQCVRRWLRGVHEPRHERMRAIVKVSGGAVTTDDVLDHFDLTREHANAKTRIA